MKKITVILAITAMVFSGCVQEELIPEDIKVENNGPVNGGEDEDPRGGKIIDAGLKFYNMPGGIFDLEEGTYDTAETMGRTLDQTDSLVGAVNPISGETYTVDANEDTRAKYIVRGPSSVSTSKLDSGGFTDVTFIYYETPLEGEFTIRARVLITAKAGDSSSKGYFFGAFTGEPVLEGGNVVDYKELPNTTSMGAGILYRTNDTADNNSGGPSMRPYFKEFVSAAPSPPGGWSTGPSQSSAESGNRLENWMNFRQPGWRQERILEVTRENAVSPINSARTSVFVLKVYDSKSEALLQTVYIYDNSINANLLVGNPVYAGIALLGTSVEFSEISLWDNAGKTGDPIFKTPRTKPAYVGVDTVTIRANRVGSAAAISIENHPTLPGASRTAGTALALGSIPNGIELTPVFSPTYADNDYFDWELVLSNGEEGNIILEKIDGNVDIGWKRAKATISAVGTGSYFIMATSRDAGLADWLLEIRVR
ncbi:MAG: hypothetical protein LBG05_09510 [Treponema sp.]|jgi:hypothetical protein|nr:hypothetical protein [Treponema sp.]